MRHVGPANIDTLYAVSDCPRNTLAALTSRHAAPFSHPS